MSLEKSQTYLPLFGFFEAWRTQGAQVGIEEYLALIKAMQDGWGFSQREEANLFTLCKLLWFNPGDSFFQFKRLFTQFYALERQDLLSLDVGELPENLKEGIKPTIDENKKPNSSQARDSRNGLDTDEKDGERLPARESSADTEGYSDSISSGGSSFVKLGDNVVPDYHPAFSESEDNVDAVRQQFRFMPQPFPISTNPRIIKLLLRKLYAPKGKRISNKVDIDKTVDQLARDGGRLRTVKYQTEDLLEANLLILLDIGPTMRAFHKLADRFIHLIETELNHPVKMLYFSSTLKNTFFTNRTRTEAISISEMKTMYRRSDTPILIIGDAGAANQEYESEEILDTEIVINKLRKISHRIAWLNPMPRARWVKPSKSNAWYLRARGMEMFDMTHKGIQLAISALKGMKSIKKGKRHG